MKRNDKRSILILGIIVLISVLNFFIPDIFSNGKHLILLGVIIGLLYFLLGINLGRNSNDIKVTRNILIYIIGYYVLIYLAGFFIGFARTVYNYTVSNLVLNIIPSILGIIAIEIIRGEIITKTNKSKIVLVLSCLTFILLDISISFNAYNLYFQSSLYQFIGLLVMGSITNNILMTIIHMRTDKYPAMIYRFAIETMEFVLLVVPDLGVYLKSVLMIVLPILVSLMVINMDKKVQDNPRHTRVISKVYIVIIVLLMGLVLINSGLLRYQTLVIGSDSMYPYIKTGDVVLIDQNTNHRNYKTGDILAFKYDNKIVVHRIISKERRDGEIYYRTKGDNNDQADLIFISQKLMKGKVLFRIKYIGLPSIWLNDLFN